MDYIKCRENLLAAIKKYPALAMDALDAAYVAGLDDRKKKNLDIPNGIDFKL